METLMYALIALLVLSNSILYVTVNKLLIKIKALELDRKFTLKAKIHILNYAMTKAVEIKDFETAEKCKKLINELNDML